ncbi:RNA 3'-terminal phosphate cyclase [Desulfogranum japonicum]|uniref:RNA 3'-terminal phosphate cyclase n=1 Tax=Desulfogranum japonicum TaxID=231447 RepID=UPI000427C0B5|nr:RNA 3'-terminal phosphate cyclase [Desulfogranum japonicum]
MQNASNTQEVVEIDGSLGEGGGQVLRTCLGLSLVTGKPFTITNIRAGRRKPGIMRQHLTAIQAATQIGEAEVRGAKVGGLELEFCPCIIKPGNYHFSIGTAGSCTLVLQAILPALMVADGASEVILEGGTHNPMAPPYDYLANTFLPVLSKMGVEAGVKLDRPGFYPAGGGRMLIQIQPPKRLQPIVLDQRSDVEISARGVCAELPGHIAKREMDVVQRRLGLAEEQVELCQLDKYGPGNYLALYVRSEELTETFSGFGEKNISAEKVAGRVVKEVQRYLASGAPVGPYLADQLLIPMALAGGDRFRTSGLTAHALTNMDVITKFLPCRFDVQEVDDRVWEVRFIAFVEHP